MIEKRRLPYVLVPLALLAALGLWLAGSAERPATPAERWLTLQPQPLQHRIGLVGQLEPERTQAIVAPFDGNVASAPVEPGQRVEAGQLLLRMDAGEIEVQLREALSTLLKARHRQQELRDWENGPEVARTRRALRVATLATQSTRRKLAETQTLFERGIIPRSELDDLKQQADLQALDQQAAESELRAAQAQGRAEYRQIADMELANAQSKYDALLALLAQRDIQAPFPGIVIPPPNGPSAAADKGPPQPGSKVGQGQALLGLASLDRLKIVAKVSELDINALREGMPVDIQGDGFDGIQLTGTVATVGGLALPGDDQGSSRYAVTVALPPLDRDLRQRVRLGMSARLNIVTYRNDQAIVLPPGALQRAGERLTVDYRPAPDQPARPVEVTAGHATLEGVEVFGLEPGQVRLAD